jgi:hypothetical protein
MRGTTYALQAALGSPVPVSTYLPEPRIFLEDIDAAVASCPRILQVARSMVKQRRSLTYPHPLLSLVSIMVAELKAKLVVSP